MRILIWTYHHQAKVSSIEALGRPLRADEFAVEVEFPSMGNDKGVDIVALRPRVAEATVLYTDGPVILVCLDSPQKTAWFQGSRACTLMVLTTILRPPLILGSATVGDGSIMANLSLSDGIACVLGIWPMTSPTSLASTVFDWFGNFTSRAGMTTGWLFLWDPNWHCYAPFSIRAVVAQVMLLWTLAHGCLLAALPRELLFEIFYWL